LALRYQPPAASTLTAPGGPSEPDGELPDLRSAAWWRLGSWRKDLDMLVRLRDGLRALPDSPPEADEPEGQGDASADPAAPVTGPADTSADPAGSVTGPADTSAEPAAPVTGPGDARPDPAMVAIKETFARVTAGGDDAAAYFYASLFLRRPGLRDLFPPAMDEQRDRLLAALTRIVEGLTTPEEMASYLTQLGRDHRKFAVEPWMYDSVGEALIATLRAFSGDAFTAEAQAAWTAAYAAAAAIMIRASEEDAVSAPAFWTAEVVEREERSRGITVLTLAPDGELRYQAGQHLTVQTPRWPRVWRPYSVACCPREDGLIRLHVRAVPGGWVSTALASHTHPGDELILGPPLGTMTLEQADDRDLLCVAGGTGLSPVKAIIEQVVRDAAAGHGRKVSLFYGARCREELYDLRDLWRLADAHGGLQVTPVTSDDPAFDGMQGNVGRVAARYVPHRDCEAYLSGPPGMVRDTLRALAKAGIPPARIHFDDALLASRKRSGSGT
jgi:NAD(P)H-flavin reductase/hemoglobin-like flavoprotein